MNGIERLTEIFSRFPGIGTRQATRFVYFLLKKDNAFLRDLATSINALSESVRQCTQCQRFFSVEGKDKQTVCGHCQNQNVDPSILLIVEKDVDLENFRRSGTYAGKYFILGGLLPFLEKDPQEKIRLHELKREVKRRVEDEGLKEIIFAFSATPEGENTLNYVKKILELEPLSSKIHFSILGRGLSTGTEIEYSDNSTLKTALENRRMDP